MKHLWAPLGTLALTTTIVATGVAAGAATAPAGSSSTAGVRVSSASSLAPTVAAHGFYWQLTAAQDVVPGTVLIARQGSHRGSHGTRSDDQFFEISRTGTNDVPEAALRAYRRAEKLQAQADPDCDISWTLLAAIGRVESNHGRFGGSQLGSDGVSRPEIRGPQLNGAGPFAAIHDSDRGVLDHDLVWDRAVGQMQFLPETWASVARDGDGDGRMNPDDIDDSALGSAVYLCGAGGSLADPAGMARAAFRYNHSDYYVKLVLSFQAGYQTGVFAEPSPPPPAKVKATSVRTPAKPRPAVKPRVTKPVPAPAPAVTVPSAAPKPAPKPTPKPSPQPGPTTKPTPAGPALVQVDGTWTACGPGYCLGANLLDLGPANAGGSRADADYDRDGAVETNAEEFAGLAGKHVVLQVERRPGGLSVYLIDGHGYRNADGSLARTTAPRVAAPSEAP
jgi:membrane-bound lytic murein transglycosylase B